MAPEQSRQNGDYNHYDSIEQWDCPYCFKIISSSRPPVLNLDNCCCVEAGRHAEGDHSPPQAPAYESQAIYEPAVHYDTAVYYRRPASEASSSASITCPEGPERTSPNIRLSGTYLPLAAAPGLNEGPALRTASFNSDMSYQMRRFLIEAAPAPAPSPDFSIETAQSESNFLSQDMHMLSAPKDKGGRSSMSYRSWSDGSGGDASFCSWGSGRELMAAVGAQFAQSEGVALESKYPMTMSGVSGLSGE